MDINRKIQEIRQKPEHIRLRYIWGLVAVSMFFIIIIWIFSLEESLKKTQPDEASNLPDLKQSLEEMQSIKDIAPSINDVLKNPQANNQPSSANNQNLSSEGILNQAPAGQTENESPQQTPDYNGDEKPNIIAPENIPENLPDPIDNKN